MNISRFKTAVALPKNKKTTRWNCRGQSHYCSVCSGFLIHFRFEYSFGSDGYFRWFRIRSDHYRVFLT